MLARGKITSGAGTTTALESSARNRATADRTQQPSSPPLPRSQEAIHAIPRIETHDLEWTDPDAEVSGLNATRNARRCRTSTSSGYSSHSPPLSAGSYHCSCTSASVPSATPTATTKGQIGGTAGLAVIHEDKTIPRPIWPCASTTDSLVRGDTGADVECAPEGNRPRAAGYYARCGYSYGYSYVGDWDYGRSAVSTAREVLLELSRTLDSVLLDDGGGSLTAEEILREISRTVARGGTDGKRGPYVDYIYRLSSSSSSSLSSSKESSGVANPVNLRLYGKPLRGPKSPWSAYRCARDGHGKNAGPGVAVSLAETEEDRRRKRECLPAVFLLPECPPRSSSLGTLNRCCHKISECRDAGGPIDESATTDYRRANGEKPISQLEGRSGKNASRNQYPSIEPVYSTQLECSDRGSSSSEGIVESSAKGGWKRDGGFDKDLDFTLDGSRAERLGRAIAKAKRKRQWCRVITAILGLVFFFLSVVVVSLSVTRGRKVFGSM